MSPIYNGINQYQYDQFLVTKVVTNREGPMQNKQSGNIELDYLTCYYLCKSYPDKNIVDL